MSGLFLEFVIYCVISPLSLLVIRTSHRSLANRGYSEMLVLRTTDGGSHYGKDGFDKVDATLSKGTAMQAMLSSGLKQMRSSLGSSFRSGVNDDDEKKNDQPA